MVHKTGSGLDKSDQGEKKMACCESPHALLWVLDSAVIFLLNWWILEELRADRFVQNLCERLLLPRWFALFKYTSIIYFCVFYHPPVKCNMNMFKTH